MANRGVNGERLRLQPASGVARQGVVSEFLIPLECHTDLQVHARVVAFTLETAN
jgi:hypothetical protein